MKANTLLIAILFSGITAWSQTPENANTTNSTEDKKKEYEIKTLFGGGKTSHGGFGAIMVNYTEIGDKEALLVGGRGGWIMNHGFSIGLGGYGLTNNVYYDDVISNERVQLEMGYGGLYMEATVASKWPIHLSFPILIGAGGATYVNAPDSSDRWSSDPVADSEAFFVVEPGVNLELNITKFFRMDFGLNYRWTQGMNLLRTKDAELEGFSGGVTLKFGKF